MPTDSAPHVEISLLPPSGEPSVRMTAQTNSLLAEAESLLHVGRWAWDIRTAQFEWSTQSCELLGYAPSTPASLSRFLEAMGSACTQPEGVPAEQRLTLLVAQAEVQPVQVVCTSDTGTRYLALQARAVRESGLLVGFAGLLIDRTEQHLIEAQMTRQQHAQTISALAGGIAHEVNNPIQAIMNYAHLIQSTATDTGVQGFAAEIIAETERVSEVINSLLEFARMDFGAPALLEPTLVVHGAQALVSNLMKKDQLRFVVSIDADLPRIIGRKNQLQQVVVNLLTNSYDAIIAHRNREGREIELSVSRCELNRKPAIDIAVRDGGGGISPATLRRMFEPFFTTKSRASNAGLGLAICHSVVQQHGGQIRCETDGIRNTTMHVYLPATTEPDPPIPSSVD